MSMRHIASRQRILYLLHAKLTCGGGDFANPSTMACYLIASGKRIRRAQLMTTTTSPNIELPDIAHAVTVGLLEPPSGACSVIIDTDTWNEIDDQFAIIHALLSPQMRIETIQAAGFHAAVRNTQSFEHGMELSYEEIMRVLALSPVGYDGPVLRGSRETLTANGGAPVPSEAADNIVSRAMRERDDTLYVLALGALTNVASAILQEPQIRERICVVALGGWPQHASDFRDFNFIQDIRAAQTVFDSGVALVQVTGFGVSELLSTTRWEMERHLAGRGEIGDYLLKLYDDFVPDYPGRGKPIWDLAPGAWLMNAGWFKTHVDAAPILTDDLRYTRVATRHPMRVVDWLDRSAIFGDFFEKLHSATA